MMRDAMQFVPRPIKEQLSVMLAFLPYGIESKMPLTP